MMLMAFNFAHNDYYGFRKTLLFNFHLKLYSVFTDSLVLYFHSSYLQY